MFLRSNLWRGGIEDHGETYQGTYAAAFDGSDVVGVAAHYWTGAMILEAPDRLDAVVRAAAAASAKASGRAVKGIIGPSEQVQRAKGALELEDVPTQMDSREHLFSLELSDLVVPELLRLGEATYRAPRDDELELLLDWRVDYDVETLGSRPDEKMRAACRDWLSRAHEEGDHWVLEKDGQLVSYSAFNARLPDCVQIGGVWTPPELRSRGFARAVVAGSLLIAREAGVTSSILFTDEDNHAARTAYEALGYERVGDYAITLFSKPQKLSS